MNGYEKEINSREEQKNRIRERYKGVDRSELEFIPAKPKLDIEILVKTVMVVFRGSGAK